MKGEFKGLAIFGRLDFIENDAKQFSCIRKKAYPCSILRFYRIAFRPCSP
jgi:hypothetical protein